ncbi:MAG: hypothetical protein P1U63_04805 [Coxiellaceae bacterium]|nr:hypothetical protein [Coxiellaceae bacterium]
MSNKVFLVGLSASVVISSISAVYGRQLINSNVSRSDIHAASLAAVRQGVISFVVPLFMTAVTCCCCICVESGGVKESMHARGRFALGYVPLAAASIAANFVLNWQFPSNNQHVSELNALLPFGVLLVGAAAYCVAKGVKSCVVGRRSTKVQPVEPPVVEGAVGLADVELVEVEAPRSDGAYHL